MVNPQGLELSISRKNFHFPKDVLAIEGLLVNNVKDIEINTISISNPTLCVNGLTETYYVVAVSQGISRPVWG